MSTKILSLILAGGLITASWFVRPSPVGQTTGCRSPITAADIPADKILCLMANAFLADEALAAFCSFASDEWKIVKPFLSAHRIAVARKGAAPCTSASSSGPASPAPKPAPKPAPEPHSPVPVP